MDRRKDSGTLTPRHPVARIRAKRADFILAATEFQGSVCIPHVQTDAILLYSLLILISPAAILRIAILRLVVVQLSEIVG